MALYIKLVGSQSSVQLTSTDNRGPQMRVPNDGHYHLIPLELAQLPGVQRLVTAGHALLSTASDGSVPITTIPDAPTGGSGSSGVSGIADVPGLQAALDGLAASSGGDPAGITHAASTRTPADGDEFLILDSSAAFVARRTLWSTIKSTLKAYFDPLYLSPTGSAAGLTSFPTFNQNTTGDAATAAKWTTSRTIQINLGSTSSATIDGTGNIAPGVSGTLPVASGGTGAATLTGLIKGTGTTAMIAATAGTDYLVPTGSAASLTNFPTFNQNTTGSAATLTTGRTVQTNLASTSTASFNGSANISPGVTGTLPVANGGTGTATLTGIVKGTGTTAMVAATPDTDYLTPTGSAASLTNFPTFNQNTTGSAATLTTARTVQTNLASTSTASFNGSANIAPGVTGILPVGNGGTGASVLSGIVKGTGATAMVAAVSGTDYAPGTAGNTTGLVKSTTTTGALSTAVAGTDYSLGTSALATGIVKTTTTTGALTVAVAGDFPTLNQSTTGSAATLTSARTVQTNLASTSSASFNGSANITPGVTGTLPVGNGGTGATTLTGLVKGAGTAAMVAAVAGTDYIAPGGALGTPSALVLTNATGLPASGLVATTVTSIGVGGIELGHASDTTITRSEAGLIAVEGVVVPTITGAKRIAVVSTAPGSPDANTVYIVNDAGAPRLASGTTASGALSINLDVCDVFTATLTAATTLTFTGTFKHGQKAMIEFVDNGTARALTWPTNTGDSGVATRLATTIATKVHRVFLQYDANKVKLICMAVDAVGY